MDPNNPCVFCDPGTYVDEWGPTGSSHNGFGIYWAIPINPVTPGHTLIVPERHFKYADENPTLFGAVMAAAAAFARDRGASRPRTGSYNLIQSNGVAATQSVYHVHVHYVPRRENDGLKLPWSD